MGKDAGKQEKTELIFVVKPSDLPSYCLLNTVLPGIYPGPNPPSESKRRQKYHCKGQAKQYKEKSQS
jgi:hypothetical protein